MATILVNPDGSSNAKVGDIVVTGGGLYKKTETGSERVGDLPGGNTGDYNMVRAVYEGLTAGSKGGSSSGSGAAAVGPVIDSAFNWVDQKLNTGGSSTGLLNGSNAAPALSSSGSTGGSSSGSWGGLSSDALFGLAGLLFIILLIKR